MFEFLKTSRKACDGGTYNISSLSKSSGGLSNRIAHDRQATQTEQNSKNE